MADERFGDDHLAGHVHEVVELGGVDLDRHGFVFALAIPRPRDWRFGGRGRCSGSRAGASRPGGFRFDGARHVSQVEGAFGGFGGVRVGIRRQGANPQNQAFIGGRRFGRLVLQGRFQMGQPAAEIVGTSRITSMALG